MRKKSIAIIFCLVCSLFISGITSETALAGKTYLRIAATGPGSLWYIVAARLADSLNKGIPGVSASVAPGGAVANPRNVATGKVEFGMTFTNTAYLCYNGLPPYKKAYPNLRFAGAGGAINLTCGVPRDSKIYSFNDLYNKRINPLPVGYSTRVLVETILNLHGITFDSIKKNGGVVHGIGHSGGMAMMQDGKLDMHCCGGGLQPTFIALSEKPGLRLLGIDNKIRDKLVSLPGMKGYFKSTYPAGVYKGVDEDTPTVGTIEAFVVDKNMSDDMTYKITKILYETQTLKDAYKGGIKRGLPPVFDLKKAHLGAVIPVHPGANKYFKEKGVEIK